MLIITILMRILILKVIILTTIIILLIAIIITDEGEGIEKKDLNRIFERFYRVDKSHSKEVGGTGLGLSIVKHGAACLGAEVQVSSQEGEGSCFTVRFPQQAR